MAQLLGYWRHALDYRPDEVLTISGGDAWTGPYESTVLHGRPVVEIMNLAGYDAQTIGNHDFDFGPEELLKRAREARFPLLAANVYRVGSQVRPPYAVGSTTVRVGDARVGVVGLANIDTPVVTHPRNVAGLSFTEYEGALRREVAALRSTGVDVVVVMIHQEVEALLPLVPLLRELGVQFVGSGHSHMPSLTVDRGAAPGPEDDVILCNPGPYARSFCRALLRFEGTPPRLVAHEEEIVRVGGVIGEVSYPSAPEIDAVITRAREQASSAGDEELARSVRGLSRADPDERLGHLVVDAWLDALPFTQVAITNAGGLRQDIDPGPVTVRTVVGVLPIENYLVVIELTGAQLKEALAHPQTIAGGVRFKYRCSEDGWRDLVSAADQEGRPIDDAKVYKVVVNEFIYRGGDRYRLREFDPNPEETALHWREPVVRYLRQLGQRGAAADLEVDGRATSIDGRRCGVR